MQHLWERKQLSVLGLCDQENRFWKCQKLYAGNGYRLFRRRKRDRQRKEHDLRQRLFQQNRCQRHGLYLPQVPHPLEHHIRSRAFTGLRGFGIAAAETGGVHLPERGEYASIQLSCDFQRSFKGLPGFVCGAVVHADHEAHHPVLPDRFEAQSIALERAIQILGLKNE